MPYEPITRHNFQDESLLKLALTHSSCDRVGGDNQRLEFLGDAVLDLIVAESLYAKFPEADEGALDRCRASIVNGKSLARAATEKGLGAVREKAGVMLPVLRHRANMLLLSALRSIAPPPHAPPQTTPTRTLSQLWLGVGRAAPSSR